MRKLYLILIVFACIASCKRTVTNGPQIQFDGEDSVTGVVRILVSGSGEEDKTLAAGRNILENIASRRAFEQLMFIGLPNSTNYRLPLTPNMSRSTDNNEFLKNFFESREYRRFVIEINALSKERSFNNRKNIRFRVTINGDAFRKYLEQNNQIRKFGY
ncbi:hypothetical protein [Emticicia sp. TH156]|uniref:hypothetical protein n=1 Tax=Emticicia sp. TH156 TaxID=2067454 RepID=UPI000CBC3F19|nr:hypothetical protein [Emticicia sp. TH156]PLK42440.1 hypothetical protein C0V77_20715 [Emticicia sp. TH156]